MTSSPLLFDVTYCPLRSELYERNNPRLLGSALTLVLRAAPWRDDRPYWGLRLAVKLQNLEIERTSPCDRSVVSLSPHRSRGSSPLSSTTQPTTSSAFNLPPPKSRHPVAFDDIVAPFRLTENDRDFMMRFKQKIREQKVERKRLKVVLTQETEKMAEEHKQRTREAVDEMRQRLASM